MSKRYNIKWRDKDEKEIRRIVKNFNAKVSRVTKKNPGTSEFLPDKVSVKDLKKEIKTRQDFNRVMNSLKRFSRKGAETVVTSESGLTLTKYEIKEAKIKTRVINTKRTKERKALGISETKGTMGQASSQNLRPKKFSLNKTQKEWDKFVESLEREISANFKEEQLQKYKDNYLQGLIDNLGSKGEELAKLLKDVDPKTLYEKSVSNPLLSIDFIYDPLELETIIDAKIEAWQDEI